MTPALAYRLRNEVDGSFERVYRKHVRDVYGFSLSMLGNAQDAEDVTQTTFLNAYRALRRGERVDNLRAWLLAIAHNVCRQRFRTAARRPKEVELQSDVADAFTDDGTPTAHEIRDAMRHLSFNQRTVLVLREIEGLSYEEIAEAMELSLSAVETLLFRARQALREQLEAAEQDLGCDSVQRLISLQLDGKLSRPDRRLLRAHLRSCDECASFARRQRARKRAMPSLVAVPLPAGLASAMKGTFGGLLGAKAAAVAVGAALVGTGALVEKGVVPLPGAGSRDAKRAVASAVDDVSASGSVAPTGLTFATEQTDGAPRPAKRTGKHGGAAAKGGKTQAGSTGVSGGHGQVTASSGAGSHPTGGLGGGDMTGAGTPVTASGAAGALEQQVGSAGGGAGGAVVESVKGASGGVTQSVGGATQSVAGAAPSVAGAAPSVAGATEPIAGALDKLPPPPVSPSLQPPSIPPAPLPGLGSAPP